MKSIVIAVENNSTQKLLLELAKKMGLKAKLEDHNEMEWDFMPDDDHKLEIMIEKAEKNFNKGKYITGSKVKSLVKKWK